MYIFWFLHQTTTDFVQVTNFNGCISFDSYIKPQLENREVFVLSRCISFDSYIKPQLNFNATKLIICCISFDSYIKPQPQPNNVESRAVVYLLIPTSNHNIGFFWHHGSEVVYLLIPTSNHNVDGKKVTTGDVVYLLIPTSNHNKTVDAVDISWLYIFWFLHQTTTLNLSVILLLRCISFDSYIKPQLDYFAGCRCTGCISFDSYIKPQLIVRNLSIVTCCISFDSYIKPQHTLPSFILNKVVYLLIPTSNHNGDMVTGSDSKLYIFWFLHQTTTSVTELNKVKKLYIFWFLHQTTTVIILVAMQASCISFDSYIKPQHFCLYARMAYVVYLLIPTSNHNYHHSE